tara:strand:+ start:28348 stop:28989 length:642 start_codon:yes stop_codon:yes gene_type:complete
MFHPLKHYTAIDALLHWFSFKRPLSIAQKQCAAHLSKYEDLATYSKLYDQHFSRQKINTKVDLAYAKHIQFGETIGHIKRNMPQRKLQIINSTSGIKTKILAYSIHLGKHPAKIEMHFYKNKLFFYQFRFPQATPGEKTEITRSLIQHYELPNIDLATHAIYDKNRNCVKVEDHLAFTISYTQMANPIFIQIEALKQKDYHQMMSFVNERNIS